MWKDLLIAGTCGILFTVGVLLLIFLACGGSQVGKTPPDC
jgi:hypothetical protein